MPQTDSVRFGSEARIDKDAEQLRWFGHWLKGTDNSVRNEPPVSVFVMSANKWLDAQAWPISDSKPLKLFLGPGKGKPRNSLNDGSLTRKPQTRKELSVTFKHDPYNPIATIGGEGGGASVGWLPGPRDQRPAEKKSLTFSSGPLEKDFLLVGEPLVRFFASTTAHDTDFVITLTDVHPNGYSATLTQDAVRAKFREGEKNQLPVLL